MSAWNWIMLLGVTAIWLAMVAAVAYLTTVAQARSAVAVPETHRS
jgi:hypothetical protein